MKNQVCTIIGIVGGAIATAFGGWDTALAALVTFMAIDYITGLMVAGIFHTSPKTESGALESLAGWKGLCRKGVTLLVVLVACQLDKVMGSSFIRDAAIIGFMANEAISIIENAGHPALSTAYMNDCEPLLCFAQQVNGYGKTGDVFLGISTSGNSKNVLYAATTAHAKGMKVIGLTGAKSSKLEQMSDVCIKVPQTETYMIQELHLPVYHCLCLMLEDEFFLGV